MKPLELTRVVFLSFFLHFQQVFAQNSDGCWPESRGRIYGGREQPGLGWMCLLDIKGRSNFCGATLIEKQWLLTAGHCMVAKNFTIATADIGIYHRNILDENNMKQPLTPERIQVDAVFVHPHFKSSAHALYNDIALVHLKRPVNNMRETVLYATSHTNTTDLKGGVLLGWGLRENGQESDYLLCTEVPFKSLKECNSSRSYQGAITNSMICAGAAGRDACSGDSGGPLVVRHVWNGMDRWLQIGVISFGLEDGCAMSDFPGVHTRIAAYTNWIDRIVYGKSSYYYYNNIHYLSCSCYIIQSTHAFLPTSISVSS